MASSTETAKAYMAALSHHDVDAAVALWKPGASDFIAGEPELVAPHDIRDYFNNLFTAFPDWRFEILDTTTQRERCVVRWRTRTTFAGPGRLQGIVANGETVEIEGCDILTVKDGQIVANHAYVDRAEVLIQLGVLPGPGSSAERGMTAATNVRHRLQRRLAGSEAKVIAPGVWIVQGGFGATMNVYLLEEPDGGVTVFDAGVRAMTPAVAAAAARLGGIRRVVLGHADCDHRGSAAGLGAPVHAHPLEVEAAESPGHRRDYWDLGKLVPAARLIYPLLFRRWDGGALEVAATVEEDDEVAGFRVVHLPGHAPGLIGLLREEDGLALCSDVLYTLNVETSLPGRPRLPHAAFNHDSDQARASIRKLADLNPRAVWVGHSHPVAGAEVSDQLRRAAES